jgi:hypothetical protein
VKNTVRNVEFDEVIPPGQKSAAEKSDDAVARLIAHVMDNLFRIPGSGWRFGLDPLLGLLPYYGDAIANLISAVVLSQAARFGLPRIVIARMALNVLVNALVGSIPVFGDAFSFWFKSNARNYDLLQRYSGKRRNAAREDWVFAITLTIIIVAVILGVLLLATYILAKLIGALSNV